MNSKLSFFTLTLIFLLSMAGCAGINAAIEKPDNDCPLVEAGSKETLEETSGATILEPPNLTIYVGDETIWQRLALIVGVLNTKTV
jgi:hypothetical protein